MPESYKYCIKCGTKLSEEANFCKKCGAKIKLDTAPREVTQIRQQPDQPSPAIQYTQPLGKQLSITCHTDWTDELIWESVKTFCSLYTTDMEMKELEPNVLYVQRDFGRLGGLYKAIIKISNDPSGQKYVIVDYDKGRWKRKPYVKIFWENLYKGLNKVLSKPIPAPK